MYRSFSGTTRFLCQDLLSRVNFSGRRPQPWRIAELTTPYGSTRARLRRRTDSVRCAAGHVVARPAASLTGVPVGLFVRRAQPAEAAVVRRRARRGGEGEKVHGGAAVKTSNAMQLKVLINNREKAAGVSPQLMLQNCMLEQLIDRELSVWLALWRGVTLNRRLLCRRWGWNKSLTPIPLICSAF